MRRRRDHHRRTVAALLIILGAARVAHAQSAVDGFDPGANGTVYTFALQSDGKILVGGGFGALGGGTGTTTRNRIGRLNPDGSVDAAFDPGANAPVYRIGMQPGGKIVVGGEFSTLGGGGTGTTTRNNLGRLNVNGALDLTFDPGANGPVQAMAIQADGKILIGGTFTTVGGGGSGTTTRNYIARLNADGSVDTSFNPGAQGRSARWRCSATGKSSSAAASRNWAAAPDSRRSQYVGRLNADGSVDRRSILARTTSSRPRGPGRWKDRRQRRLHDAGRRHRHDAAQSHRPDQRRRLDRRGIQSRHQRSRVLRRPAERKDRRRRILLDARRGRNRHDPAQIGRLNADGSLDTSFNPGANKFRHRGGAAVGREDSRRRRLLQRSAAAGRRRAAASADSTPTDRGTRSIPARTA